MEAQTLERSETIPLTMGDVDGFIKTETWLNNDPQPRNYRTYTDLERANTLTTLDLCEGNLSETSRKTGIPIKTIQSWRDGNINGDVAKFRNEQRKELADICEDSAYEFIAQARATVEHSKGTQAATGAAIFIDKMRLLRDQSTQNIATQNNDLSATIQRLSDYFNKYELTTQQKLRFIQNIKHIDQNQILNDPNIKQLIEAPENTASNEIVEVSDTLNNGTDEG